MQKSHVSEFMSYSGTKEHNGIWHIINWKIHQLSLINAKLICNNQFTFQCIKSLTHCNYHDHRINRVIMSLQMCDLLTKRTDLNCNNTDSCKF